jgi:hypothetical protein
MDVEFYAPDDEEKRAIATAAWDGREVTVTAEDPGVRETLVRSFRKSPIAVDEPALRRMGTSGPVVIQPGSLEWARAVSQHRATEESKLAARFVARRVVSGWDPAADYRTFGEQIEKLDELARDEN